MTEFARIPQLVAQLVGNRDVIPFSPALARTIGNVEATVFLCQACYWQSIVGNGKWFYKLRDAERDSEGRIVPPSDPSRQSWEWETALSRARQESARKHLTALGVLEQKLCGLPAQLYFRVNLERLIELLSNQLAETPPTGWNEAPRQDGGDHAGKPAEAPPAKRTKTTAELNAKTTTTTPLRNDGGRPSPASRLIFDRTVTQHRELLTALLTGLPVGSAQDIADELAGVLRAQSLGRHKGILNVRSWLERLIKLHGEGRFVPEFGPAIATERLRAKEQHLAEAAAVVAQPETVKAHVKEVFRLHKQWQGKRGSKANSSRPVGGR